MEIIFAHSPKGYARVSLVKDILNLTLAVFVAS